MTFLELAIFWRSSGTTSLAERILTKDMYLIVRELCMNFFIKEKNNKYN